MKYFCFRFDIDTHKCIKEGVPNLIKLGRELEARFTFFVNMGRSISLLETLKKGLSPKAIKKNNDKNISKFSPLKKLGIKDYIIAASINPEVGFGNIKIVKRLIEEGHEFGLHGGRNHSKWQNNAKEWKEERVKKEIDHVINKIIRQNLPSPAGFASPGFEGSKNINKALKEIGFKYVSDSYSIDGHKVEGVKNIYPDSGLPNINVNITSGNDVAYIESLRSRGFSDKGIIKDFKRQLESTKKIAIVYDHPCYAGIQELEIVRQMVNEAKRQSFKPVTIKEIYENCIGNP